MTPRGDWNRYAGQHLHELGRIHDLWLGPTDSKEEINDSLGTSILGCQEPDAAKLSLRLSLQDLVLLITEVEKLTDQCFCLGIAPYRDDHIDVHGVADVCPGHQSQGSHESPPGAQVLQIGGQPSEIFLQAIQGESRGLTGKESRQPRGL